VKVVMKKTTVRHAHKSKLNETQNDQEGSQKNSNGLLQRSIQNKDQDGYINECLDISTYSVEAEDSAWQPCNFGEYKQLNLLKSTQTLRQSCDRTSQEYQFTQISKTTAQNQNSISSQWDSPAQGQVTQELEQAFSTQHHHCGERDLDASCWLDLNFALSNNLKELSDEDLEQFLEDSDWQDTVTRLKQSRRRSLEQDTRDLECLSFPTLTSGQNSSNKRPAGQTKLEMWFRNKGLIPNGSQLSSQAIAMVMGFPPTWFDCLSPTKPKEELEADTSQVEQLPQDRQVSPLEESFISIPCVIKERNKQPVKGLVIADYGLDLLVQVGQTKVRVNKLFVHTDFGMLEQSTLSPSKNLEKARRGKGEGSGYINFRTVTKNGKDYKQAYYHWEQWEYGDRITKSSKYIPRKMESTIIRMNHEKVPVENILKVLRSKGR